MKRSREIDMVNMWGMICLSNDASEPLGETFPNHVHALFGENKRLVMVGTTGSDAVSHLCTLADIHAMNTHPRSLGVTVLTLSDSYGSARGPLLRRARPFLRNSVANRARVAKRSDVIEAPWIRAADGYDDLWRTSAASDECQSSAVEEDLTDAETKALSNILRTISELSESEYPVGGVLFEAVHQDAEKALRPQFVRALCVLCRERNVLALEDACMTSVRCGWRFLSEAGHYQPDAVALAKVWGMGLVVVSTRGLLASKTTMRLGGLVTSVCDTALLSILERKAATFNAPSFLKRVRDAGETLRSHIPGTKGLGLLIHVPETMSLPNVHFAFDRLLPQLDITDEQIREIHVTDLGSVATTRTGLRFRSRT